MAVKIAPQVLAAIDVGTNAVRLRLAQRLPDGSLETLVAERDAVRPGEGVFKTGMLEKPVADRLIATLRRYAQICRRHDARVRAVATSAVREAKNGPEIVRRAREEAGILLEVISGKEEARLITMGVLQGVAPHQRSLCIDIGGGSTEVAIALGEKPQALWSVALGAVRLADVFEAHTKVPGERLALMRQYAAEEMEQALPPDLPGDPRSALGSSGTIQAVVAYASGGKDRATAREIRKAVDTLARMGPKQRRKLFDARRADIVVAGAVVLEAVVRHFRLDEVVAVDRGLRDGLLVDLLRGGTGEEGSLAEAAVAVGRRFDFDEKHARQVARLACAIFDALPTVHRLPRNARSFLEVAALLHDIGHAVSYQRHHKHTYYLIQHADIPGLSDRERELVARIARYHRRSIPELSHPGMEGLTAAEAQMVRRLATILRLADSLDRSHRQPIQGVKASMMGDRVALRLSARGALDLEMWDAANDAPLFRRVFGRKLTLRPVRG